MRANSLATAGLLGAGTSVVMIALTYLGSRLAALPFVPFDIFDWMARHLPGALINAVIESIIRAIRILKLGPTASTAKTIEQGIALAQFVVAGAAIGIVLALVARRWPRRTVVAGLVLGVIFFAKLIAIEAGLHAKAPNFAGTIVWLGVIIPGWGVALGRMIRDLARPAAPESLPRRRFLYLAGAGSFAILVTAAGARILQRGEPRPAGDLPSAAGPPPDAPPVPAGSRFTPVAGTRDELTPNDKFYRVDINTTPQRIDGASWRLEIGGLVDRPLTLTLADIRARRAVTQPITLECISNEVGGDLISTSQWTGVPFKDILAEVSLKAAVREIAISAADGFYESVPLQEALDDRTLLVYAMNGEPLAQEHGFPLRIYIPGHHGMKQPKWITRMEAIDHAGAGYWVERGWSATAFVHTTSVVDVVATNEKDAASGLVPVGGIAYSGARGISKVEIQVDDGPWDRAELRIPPLGPLTWVQWRYAWKATLGKHAVRVRAYDGSGALQETAEHGTFPNGATGIDSETATIRG